MNSLTTIWSEKGLMGKESAARTERERERERERESE